MAAEGSYVCASENNFYQGMDKGLQQK